MNYQSARRREDNEGLTVMTAVEYRCSMNTNYLQIVGGYNVLTFHKFTVNMHTIDHYRSSFACFTSCFVDHDFE